MFKFLLKSMLSFWESFYVTYDGLQVRVPYTVAKFFYEIVKADL